MQFGKYRLLRKIGTGGMASIYLATLDGPDDFKKHLVIKRVHPHLSELPEFAQMFATEAKVAARLNHPNIVQVYEYGTIDGAAYLAMEWIEGASLDALLRGAVKAGATLGPELALQVGVQICEALHYAHELCDDDGQWMGLVHRDVSLSNILLDGEGGVKLVDFGIAKVTQAPSMTATGTMKGKLAYMAPEQLHGTIDRRADLFSLGIVLYEVAVGRRLFKRATDAETITALARCEVPDPAELSPDFPPALSRVLERVLEHDPDRRFSTAAEMGEALEAAGATMGQRIGRRGVSALLSALPFDPMALSPSVGIGSSPSVAPPSGTGLHATWRDRSDPLPSVPASAVAPPADADPASVDPVWAIVGSAGAISVALLIWWFLLT